MSSEFLISVLAIISVLTSLTVEGIKKILDENHKDYASNLLAVIVSVILTVAISVGYMIYCSVPFTAQTAVVMVAMVFLSFLSATVGYDKVRQLLEQLDR